MTFEATPAPLQRIINLILLAFGLAILQTVVYFGADPEVFAESEFSGLAFWGFLGTLLVFMALIFFLYYYLCLYRPVKKRKRSAAKWLFWANTAMLMLTIYTEYAFVEPQDAMSVLETTIYVAEVTIIYYAAYLLTRPEYKEHLVS